MKDPALNQAALAEENQVCESVITSNKRKAHQIVNNDNELLQIPSRKTLKTPVYCKDIDEIVSVGFCMLLYAFEKHIPIVGSLSRRKKRK